LAHVVFAGGDCQRFTSGASELDVAATSVRGLIHELNDRFPGLGDYVDKRMAVAIDGEINQDAYAAEIGPLSEVYLIPKIGGG
jgi:hypothetical protein